MGVADYTTVANVSTYMPDVDTTVNSAILTTLIHSASRFLDYATGQWFYDDGASTKYFDAVGPAGQMEGGPYINTYQPFFTVTSVQLAYFENQPLAQWLTLSGDGVTPPSNFYLWPRNPRRAGNSANPTHNRPYWAVDLAHLPSPNTTFLPIVIGGLKTCSIAANWGWPSVPDVITDLTNKLVVRAWRSRESGWKSEIGGASFGGTVNMSHYFDSRDEELLVASELLAVVI